MTNKEIEKALIGKVRTLGELRTLSDNFEVVSKEIVIELLLEWGVGLNT